MSEQGAVIARLRDLLAGTAEVKPYKQGEAVYLYCGKAGGTVKHAVMVRPNSNMTADLPPEKQYTLCSTYGCMSMPRPPVRYRVTEHELASAVVRALPLLLNALDAESPQP